MGTKQILMLILSVIIVGLATSAGLMAFRQHIVNANRRGIISDMNFFAALAIIYYKSPKSSAGGNGAWDWDGLMTYISYPTTPNGSKIVTKNGKVRIRVTNNGQKLIFVGYGNEIGLDEDKAVKARLVLRGPDAEPRLVFLN